GAGDVGVSTSFQRRLGAGIFGGTGFTLQRVSGDGYAWVELSGEVVQYDLQPGETLRVHPGHVGMFDARVSFDIAVMRGIRNILFGADGLFLAALTGPGRVWLQSLTISNLAQALLPYLPLPERDNGQ
ncbi:AIM24 family protein, partial [Nocardia gipuzkoensis]